MADNAPPAPAGTSAPTRKRPRVSPPPAGRPAPPPPPPLPSSLPSMPSPPPPSAPLLPNESLGTLPVQPPAAYLSRAASNPSTTAFQLPFHLTSFSYSPTRELLTSRERKDEALAVYREPRHGSDLNRGFEQATWRESILDEGLDALLDTLSEFARSNSHSTAADEMLGKISVITWRGMLTKLMLAVYEADNVEQGRRGDGWEMNAMVVDGCLYLEDSCPPAKLAAKAASESSYLLQSYYGYCFEAYSTTPYASSFSSAPPPEFEPPNTNVQWCSVVKTNLGGFRTIVGGEVDCVRPGANKDRISTRDFIELKTNMTIRGDRDAMNFERQKLLKHYVQSFLLGVPTITVGFRTREGQITGLQSFNTLEIPRLVRDKPHAWDPLACLSSAQSLLSFITRTITTSPSSLTAEAAFLAPFSSSPSSPSSPENGEVDADPLPSYPVFRLSFTPTSSALGPAGLSIRELTEEEVRVEVLSGKKKGEGRERVGFLWERWVRESRERRRRLVEIEMQMLSATTSMPHPTAASSQPPVAANPSHVHPPPPAPAQASTAPAANVYRPSHQRRQPPPPPPPLESVPSVSSGGNGGAAGGGGGVAAGLRR